MKRRQIIVATVTAGVLLLALLAADTKPSPTGKLLVLDWAAKSSLAKPPTAILIEFGMKDTAPTDWTGSATVKGAKIVHREGYRFREKAGDKLTDPDGWTMKSHRGMRVPPNQPAVAKMEGIATVGVVLHLAELEAEASVSLETTGAEKSKSLIPLKD